MTENSHPLEIRFEPAEGERGLTLDVVVHNPTSRKVFLQIVSPEVLAIEATLTGATAEPVEGMHNWANRGFMHKSHLFHEIPPGGAHPLDRFELIDAETRATGGAMRWDLREHRGETVRLSFTFTADCVDRTTDLPEEPLLQSQSARPKRTKDVFCGTLTSPVHEIAVPPWTQDNVLTTLVREPVLDPAAYDWMVPAALTHESEKVRQTAAFSLGEIGRVEAAVALVPLLTDPVREVRGSAARAMGSLGNPEVLPALEAVSTREQDSWVRGRIFDAIKTCQPQP